MINIKEKNWFKITFNMNFSPTKVMAYLILILSFSLSFYLKETSVATFGMGSITLLLVGKKVSDNYTMTKVNKTNDDEIISSKNIEPDSKIDI